MFPLPSFPCHPYMVSKVVITNPLGTRNEVCLSARDTIHDDGTVTRGDVEVLIGDSSVSAAGLVELRDSLSDAIRIVHGATAG